MFSVYSLKFCVEFVNAVCWCLQIELHGKTHRTITTLLCHFVPLFCTAQITISSSMNALLHPVGGGACYCVIPQQSGLLHFSVYKVGLSV